MKYTIEQIKEAYNSGKIVNFRHCSDDKVVYTSHKNKHGKIQVDWESDGYRDVSDFQYNDAIGYIEQNFWTITGIISTLVEPVEDKEDTSNWHPHHDFIVAWAKGAKIQYESHGQWIDTDRPNWYEDYQYRVKPVPVKKWLWVYKQNGDYGVTLHHYVDQAEFNEHNPNDTDKILIQKIEDSEQEFEG